MPEAAYLKRHRDINRRHGNLLGTLRKTYSERFASGSTESAKLSEVLRKTRPGLQRLQFDKENHARDWWYFRSWDC